MSFRAAFLIVVAAIALHLSWVYTLAVLIGYIGFAALDSWIANREKARIIDDEVYGWKADPEDVDTEINGSLVRVRLRGGEQVIVARIAELLRRIPS